MRESVIQTRIREALEKADWIVIKLITTSKPGIPDLMALRQGVTVFIEVKQITGKVAPLQKYRHTQLTAAGFECIVARGLKDVEHLLIKY